MDRFIYVFDTAARDMLSQAGFLLLKGDEQNKVWVFLTEGGQEFDPGSAGFSYLTSNTLTF